MDRCNKFLDFFDYLVQQAKEPVVIPQEVQEFYDLLVASRKYHVNKPLFTDLGLQVLEYMQTCGTASFKAKEIGEAMNLPSRKISGAMTKLVADEYVEKYGANPVVYTLTNKGKNFDVEMYKGEINNEEEHG